MSLTVISYGGGVQSTALVVLAATGRLGHVDAAVFANIGDDSEHPDSLRYVRDVATPWAAERGLPVVEIQRPGLTLLVAATASLPATPVPMRMGYDGKPGNRTCTEQWKIAQVRRWCRERGASRHDPATVLVGFSTDEIERATSRQDRLYERKAYPLLGLGLDRAACMAVIQDAGLPIPRKSSCWFCPFHRLADWAELRRDHPDLFDASVALEDAVNAARPDDPLRLTRVPLEAIDAAQDWLFDADDLTTCDSGACFT